jgi:hypothetical protein
MHTYILPFEIKKLTICMHPAHAYKYVSIYIYIYIYVYTLHNKLLMLGSNLCFDIGLISKGSLT